MSATEGLPQRIGRHLIRRELGRGTMGVVYEAHDPLLGRRLAVKSVLLGRSFAEAERAAFEQRFLTEARIAAQLQHPGIVVVHDIGRDADSGGLYIALEYLEGRTLEQVISSGTRLPWQETLRIVARVAEALHHAHAHGVVHRDVKPANVMLLASGEPKIMDFGIARLDASRLTVPGAVFGTPLYMSPEQAKGDAVDPRSDLFSLGTITYALLVGASPFEASNVPAILARVTTFEPAPPSSVAEGLPSDVDTLVARAMARDPERRYPTGEMLAEDFDDVRAGRAPRHAAGWVGPSRGQATVVAAPVERKGRVANVDLREVAEQLTTPPRAAASPTRRRSALLALLVVVAAASWILTLQPDLASLWFSLLQGRIVPTAVEDIPDPLPAATPASSETLAPDDGLASDGLADSDATDTTADGAGSDYEEEAGEILVGDGSEAPEDEGEGGAGDPVTLDTSGAASAAEQPAVAGATEASASPAAQPTPKETPQRQRAAVARSAVMRLELEHNVKSGLVDVWLDEEPVMTRRIRGRVTKKVLFFESHAGRFATRFRMKPGKHSVRVRVRWDGHSASAGVRATFSADTTRRLRARLDGGKLTLYW